MYFLRPALLASCLCFFLAGIFPRLASAQKGFYFRAGGGYLAPHAAETGQGGTIALGVNALGGSWTLSGPDYFFKTEKASLGAGPTATLAPGYMFSPNLGLELGVTAVVAPREYQHTFIGEFFGGAGGATPLSYTSTTTTQARTPICLLPALVVTAGESALQVYVRAGMAIALNKKVQSRITTTGSSLSGAAYSFMSTSELTLRTGVGLTGGLGVRYRISKLLGVWLEASAISLTRHAAQREMVEAVENGVDLTQDMTTSQRFVNYVEEGSIQIPADRDKPSEAPTFSLPFGGAGGQAGLSFSFSGD